jgi:hypothetical protein
MTQLREDVGGLENGEVERLTVDLGEQKGEVGWLIVDLAIEKGEVGWCTVERREVEEQGTRMGMGGVVDRQR